MYTEGGKKINPKSGLDSRSHHNSAFNEIFGHGHILRNDDSSKPHLHICPGFFDQTN